MQPQAHESCRARIPRKIPEGFVSPTRSRAESERMKGSSSIREFGYYRSSQTYLHIVVRLMFPPDRLDEREIVTVRIRL